MEGGALVLMSVAETVAVPAGRGPLASFHQAFVIAASLADVAVPRAASAEQLMSPERPSTEGEASAEGISGDIFGGAACAAYGEMTIRRVAPADVKPLDGARNP